MNLARLKALLSGLTPTLPLMVYEMNDDVTLRRQYAPGTVGSYRGYYDRPAISTEEISPEPVTVGAYLAYLEGIEGSLMTGWKGGEFPVDSNSLVYLADPGEATDVRPVAVVESDGIAVIVAYCIPDW